MFVIPRTETYRLRRLNKKANFLAQVSHYMQISFTVVNETYLQSDTTNGRKQLAADVH